MKTDRLVAILMVLLNHDKVTATRLAEMFEVSTRTIYRDIASLELAGIPMAVTSGVTGGISIMPQFRIDKRFFTAKDVQNLLTGLNSASAALSAAEAAGITEKVKSLLPKETLAAVEQRGRQIAIDPSPWIGSRDVSGLIQTIRTGFSEDRYLDFGYRNTKGEETRRRIEPYQLVSKAGHWYVQGYCTLRKAFRIFKLSRMEAPRLSAETFVPREFVPRPFSDGPPDGKKLITVRIRIDESIRERVADTYGDLDFIPCEPGKLVADIPFMEEDFSYDLLLGFGHRCECIGPSRVREKLAGRIRRMLDIYAP